MTRITRRGLHVRDYFWRELLCRVLRHRRTHDAQGYGYCRICGDTLD